MNQFTLPTLSSGAFRGALYMVLAGVCFATANAITFVITAQLGFLPQSDTFWQYAIALAFSLPFVLRHGLAGLKTDKPIVHIIRVVLSALGVQAFVMSLAAGTPIWQVIALVMTAPLFVLLGAKLFLGETVTPARWIAASVGLAGALVVSDIWTTGFTTATLYPIAAAVLWGASSLLTKYLTRTESAPTVTLWLLVLLTPINAGLSAHAGFQLPTMAILAWLVVGGVIMMAAQYLLTWSYAAADAAFVQPFDDLKLVSNIVIYGLWFGYWPQGNIWLGIAMILGASLFLLLSSRGNETQGLPA
ncbi:MAG: DMT family transporter [Candidatus Saccharibacteria bacterium]|nr:DMT family transporter [Pseudorhodobacter sp.]